MISADPKNATKPINDSHLDDQGRTATELVIGEKITPITAQRMIRKTQIRLGSGACSRQKERKNSS